MLVKEKHKRLRLFGEVMGLAPLPLRLKEARIAVMGEEDVPRSKFGLSSLQQLYPRISPRMWRGRAYLPKTVIISNLFNHTQTPIEEGWSVEKTQTRDFRGKNLTYNSHNGTDFAIPVGSTVCAAAPGKVVAVISEFNRGGLKIFIDHGNGVITSSGHLARSFVKQGQVVHRGEPIALSGYSGLDAVVTFPFGIPHVHFNVWLNGEPVDPFPHDNNESMWRAGNMPVAERKTDEQLMAANFNEQRTHQAIEACKTPALRQMLAAIPVLHERAANTIIKMNYYPTRFTQRYNLYEETFPRLPLLSLPFAPEEFNRLVFLDELLAQ
ncbi:MAG: M23 family metallopeptidase [Chitinophagales bacterium]|nr:M23 family metallopeptidase [Chitinophagales bacterium]